MLAIALELEMGSVEAQHASIRRLQHTVACHAPAENIMDAPAEFLLRRYRDLGLATSKKKTFQATQNEKRNKSEPERTRNQGEDASRRQRKDAHRGGPWRAFIRQAVIGSTGKADFAELAKRYKALPAQERAILKDVGACAKSSARGRNKGQSAFGPTSRQMSRSSQKRALEEDAARILASRDDLADGGGLEDRRGRARFTIGAAVEAETSVLPLRSALGERSSSAPSSTYNTLLQNRKVERKVLQLRQAQREAAWARHREGVGAEQLGKCCNVSKSFQTRREEFIAVPHRSFNLLQWTPEGVKGRVKQALKINSRTSAGSSAQSLLGACWGQLHLTHQSDPTVRTTMVGVKHKPRPCAEAGTCICDKGMEAAVAMVKTVNKMMSTLCPPHSRRREQLAQGELLLLLVGTHADAPGDVAGASAADEPAAALPPSLGARFQFGHIGSHCLSPWQSWFQVAHADSSFEDVAGARPAVPVRVRVFGEFSARFDYFHSLDVRLTWTAQCWEVVWSNRMLGEFLPHVLDVQPCGGVAPVVIWDPREWGDEKDPKEKSKSPWELTLGEPASGESESDAGTSLGEYGDEFGNGGAVDEPEDAPMGALVDAEEDAPASASGGASGAMSDVDSNSSGGEDDSSDSGTSLSVEELVAGVVGPIGDDGAGGVEGSGGSSGSCEPSSSSSDADSESDSATTSGSPTTSPPPAGALPPLPPPPEGPPGLGGGGAHEVFRVNEWTTITWFHLGERKDFIATCKYPGHVGCVLTRTTNESPWAKRAGQGRCLGMLVAWCRRVADGDVPSKEAHFELRDWLKTLPSKPTRVSARDWFKLQGPIAEEWLRHCERPEREMEGEEPDLVP